MIFQPKVERQASPGYPRFSCIFAMRMN